MGFWLSFSQDRLTEPNYSFLNLKWDYISFKIWFDESFLLVLLLHYSIAKGLGNFK